MNPGERIAWYEIIGMLGVGGMGEVYRARDTKLNREVAIKVLPSLFTADRERVLRFEREAQTLALLNHPNIAQVHGVVDEPLALVMELVEGDDLSARIGPQGMPLEQVLPIARQIAEALEAAHERGVVHRDLKPANIKVREDGVVKVLDFGLAKALDSGAAAPAIANSPTFVTAATNIGTVLGTAPYMSPEQARGKAVDKRSDIWAFGCVMFEMLAGSRPFDGETITDILGAIVHKAPDLSLLPAQTPPSVITLIARCLEKDVARRLRDIGEARLALEPSQVTPVDGTVVKRSTSIRSWPLRVALVVAGLALGVALGMYAWPRPQTGSGAMRLTMALPAGFTLTQPPVVSPDGRTVAYVAGAPDGVPALYLRALDSFEARRVPGTTNAVEPFFSPDSRFVGFFAAGELRRANVSSGTSTLIQRVPGLIGASWGEDGHIVFSAGAASGLKRVPAEGGEIEDLTQLQDPTHYAHVWPQQPAAGTVMFRAWTSAEGSDYCQLRLADRLVTCFDSPYNFRFVRSGHALTDGWSSVQAFPLRSTGEPQFEGKGVALLTGVYWRPNGERNYYSVSENGTLAYAPGNPTRQRIVWIGQDGSEETLVDEDGIYGRVSLSPDGRRVAYGGSGHVWVLDLERKTRSRIASESNNLGPMWSADGQRVIFSSNRRQGWAGFEAAAQSEWAQREILRRPYGAQPSSIAPNGMLLFTETHPQTREDLWLLHPGGEASPFAVSPHREGEGRFSPDGRLVAYTSDANGRTEVFVKPSAGGQAVQVSTDGGRAPAWSRVGNRLYYSQGASRVMAVTIDAAGRAGLPQQLLNRQDIPAVLDTSLDGKRLLAVKFLPESIPAEIRVITNIFDELRQVVK